ncbi:hypothetical protein [Geomonas ferrireducens]|uniref:hypothetical protein n=1 Tax=Geomonas ferrireducens TaxID=2570227 RepID=UPI001FEC6EC2|nr:hypothetical protein [Geomonas ferrireducens]
MGKLLKAVIAGIALFLMTGAAFGLEAAPVQVETEASRQATGEETVCVDGADCRFAQASDEADAAEPADAVDAAEPAEAVQAAKPVEASAAVAVAKPETAAARQTAEQVKGLDEQVQEIKADVLSIAAQLSRLEEKLLYPSDTQVALFVSLAGEEKFRLDSVSVELDGKEVAHHLYTYNEIEALRKGGVQRIHVGNAMTGEHPLHVTVTGKTEGGTDFRKDESFKVAKGVGPKLVGVVLSGSKSITVKDW